MSEFVVSYAHLTGSFCLLVRHCEHEHMTCAHHLSPIDPRWADEIVKCPNVVRIVSEGEKIQTDRMNSSYVWVKMISDGAEGYFSGLALQTF